MTNNTLAFGKLNLKDPRSYWAKEDRDFTPWLHNHGIARLNDALGLKLIPQDTEVPVGRYKVDMICKDKDGEIAVIENQLEQSDHDHLGKLVVYASLKKARYAIWIVPDVTEEHRDAVEWLNKNTTDGLRFYLVQLKVLTIGEPENESAPAISFEKIVGPDEEQKMTGITGARQLYFKYWSDFSRRASDDKELKNVFRSFQKGLPQNWYNVHIGFSDCKFELRCSGETKTASFIGLHVTDDGIWEKLKANASRLEEAFAGHISWAERDKSYMVSIERCQEVSPDGASAQKKDSGFDWFKSKLLSVTPVVREILSANQPA